MKQEKVALGILGVVVLAALAGFVSLSGSNTAAEVADTGCLCTVQPLDYSGQPLGQPQPHFIRVDYGFTSTVQSCTNRCQELFPPGGDILVQGVPQ